MNQQQQQQKKTLGISSTKRIGDNKNVTDCLVHSSLKTLLNNQEHFFAVVSVAKHANS